MVKLMGCFFGRTVTVDDSGESHVQRQFSKLSSETRMRGVHSSRRRESFRGKVGDKNVVFLDETSSGSKKVSDIIEFQGTGFNFGEVVNSHPAIVVVPKAVQGEQVAAGWPYWLASVASEAINGWIPRRTDTFQKIEKIGQGTYSTVYKARDLTHDKIVALKRVRFDNMDPESVKFMAREILILRKLDHQNVIKLEGLIAASCSLYLIFEYMEHDLTGLASLRDSNFSEPQVKCYMKQLLSGLDHCHSRGVLHRDIKGSNLLIDNNGILKIADFGLAASFDPKQSQPLTSRVVTLWYRPPELLLGATYYGISVDLWSAGCILGELYARKPIMPGRTEVEQLHKIFKLCGSPSEEYWSKLKVPHSSGFKPLQPYKRRISESFKDFPPVAVGLMETLLAIDPAHRETAAHALNSEFFTTKPLPCDPSCLPKYAPSKEMDAKLREEESRRLCSGRGRGLQIDQEKEGPKSSRALPTPNAHAELAAEMQKRQGNSKSRNELLSPNHHEASLTDVSHHAKEINNDVKDHNPQRISQSGPLVPGGSRSRKRYDDIPIAPSNVHLSTRLMSDHSNIVAASHHTRKGQAGTKQPIPLGNGMKNKIHFSGPLLVPKKNMDQMLKEHDRHIQEAARRARIERARLVTNRQ